MSSEMVNSKIQPAVCLLQKLTTFLLCILKLKWFILWVIEHLMQWRGTVNVRFHSCVNFFWCHHHVAWCLRHRHYRATECLKCHIWNINPEWRNGWCVIVSNRHKTQWQKAVVSLRYKTQWHKDWHVTASNLDKKPNGRQVSAMCWI